MSKPEAAATEPKATAPKPEDAASKPEDAPAAAPRKHEARLHCKVPTHPPAGSDPAGSMTGIVPPLTSTLVAVVVAATTLAWWSTTDRLDLPKQWVLVFCTLAAVLITWIRGRPLALGPLTLLLVLAPLMGLAASPTEGAARVEGWVGWMAALALVFLARHASRAALGPPLTALALGLSLIAWLQAGGLSLFGGGIEGPGGRGVVGTLGGPNHLGWMLALLLPWAFVTLAGSHRWRGLAYFGLLPILGALVLSGSRTAWAAALVSLPFWLPLGRAEARRMGLTSKRWLMLSLVALLAFGSALVADRIWDTARLPQRASDIREPSGTASGRLYIWRVHLHALPDQLRLGDGPESFVRKWPQWQAAYLAKKPQDARFRSDLRHAHADAMEVLSDLGLPGLVLGAWLLFRVFRRRPDESSPRGPPLGSLVALVVAGLASSPLFFAPTLALGAVCLGLRLGPPQHTVTSLGKLLPALALAVALVPLTQRLRSEVVRSDATRHRMAQAQAKLRQAAGLPMAAKGKDAVGDAKRTKGSPHPAKKALAYATTAVHYDRRNPRAWIEMALALESLGKLPEALKAWRRAYKDLPTDAVRHRIAQTERILREMDAEDGAPARKTEHPAREGEAP